MSSGGDTAEQTVGLRPAPLVVIVTGMSGAGRTTAIKALEDLGFEALNNFPLSLMDRLTKSVDDTARPIALGVWAMDAYWKMAREANCRLSPEIT